MDSVLNQDLTLKKPKQRNLTKIGEAMIPTKKPKRALNNLNASLLKIYKVHRINRNAIVKSKPDTSRTSRHLQALSMNSDLLKESINFPTIIIKPTLKTQRRLTIQGKQEKLSALIDNYMGDQAMRTPRVSHQYNSNLSSENPPDSFIYAQKLQELRGKELEAYNKDVEKNLKIENSVIQI